MDFVVASLLDLLPPAELALIRAFSIRRTYRNGEVIHERGDVAASVGIVVSGQVRLIHIAPGGQELLINLVNPGQNYGDVLIFGKPVRTHRALAVGETAIDHIQAEAFNQLMIHPSIVRAFYAVAAQRLSQVINLLDDMRTLSPEVRLAKLLMSMVPPGGGKVDCLQEDLASLLGVSGVTLAKALGVLRGAELVTTGYRQMHIPDPDRLRAWIARREAE